MTKSYCDMCEQEVPAGEKVFTRVTIYSKNANDYDLCEDCLLKFKKECKREVS